MEQQPQADANVSDNGVSKRKKLVIYNLKQICLIFLASLSTAIAVEVFLLPSDIVIGSALGIASILDILLCSGNTNAYFSAGVWLLAINVPIFIYCFVTFRRRFAVKTLLYVVFLSVLLVSLRLLNVAPWVEQLMYGSDQKDRVIYVILGGALHGVSLPIMFSVNASTGGSDIVGIMVQRRSKKSSSTAMRAILTTNVGVVLISSIVFYLVKRNEQTAVNMFVYSVAAMFIGEIVQEWIFKGFSAALEMEVTTDKPTEMVEALQNGLKHGTTTLKVVGGFTRQERTMILCVVNKQQLTLARKIIHQVDEKAFAYVENVKEVVGKGFANKEIELDSGEM